MPIAHKHKLKFITYQNMFGHQNHKHTTNTTFASCGRINWFIILHGMAT